MNAKERKWQAAMNAADQYFASEQGRRDAAARPSYTQQTSDHLASKKQVAYIKSLIRRNGTSDLSVTGPIDYVTLTSRQASTIISELCGEG